MRRNLLLVTLLLAAGVAVADGPPEAERASGATAEQPAPAEADRAATAAEDQAQKTADETQAKQADDPKLLDGMSILGNQEAPKALVIVPWKTSELGGSLGISPMLDGSRQPVDKEVFLRALRYYEIRSETKL